MNFRAFGLMLSVLIYSFFFSHSASAADAETLRKIADSVTVKIQECRRDPVEQDRIGENLESDNSELCFEDESSFRPVGSGVIIASREDTYYVLTAQHVVSSINSTPYSVVLPETKESIQLSIVTDKMGLPLILDSDMALLSFETENSHGQAILYTGCVLEEWSQIGIPIKGEFPFSPFCQPLQQPPTNLEKTEAPQILISGFPSSQKGDAPALLSLGTFIDRNSRSLNLQTPVAGGYDFLYSSVTEEGMSGGAILDTSGRLIGIHGAADGDPVSRLSFGYGLGIPIDRFLRQFVLALSTDYNLSLTILDSIELLPREGSSLVVVASVNGFYHIRVFDKDGRIAVDRHQRGFDNRQALIQKLDSVFARGRYSERTRDELLREIADSLGSIPSERISDEIEFLSSSSPYAKLNPEDISMLLGGEASNCLPEDVGDDINLSIEYGSRLVQLGKHYEALDCFTLANSIHAASPLPIYGMGMILLRLATLEDEESQQENLIRARKLLEEASEAAANNTSTNRQQYIFQYNLGRALNQLEEYEEAVQVLDQAIVNYRNTVGDGSEYVQAWATRAIALNAIGQVDEAARSQNLAGSDLAGYGAALSRGYGLYESAMQKTKEGYSLVAEQMLYEADVAFDVAEDLRSPSTNSAELWVGKSKVQTALKNYQEAKMSLGKGIQNGALFSLEVFEIIFEISSSDFENSFEWGKWQVERALKENESNYAALYFRGMFLSMDTTMTDYLSRYEAAYQSCSESVLINDSFQPAVECQSHISLVVEDIKALEEKCEALRRDGKARPYWEVRSGYFHRQGGGRNPYIIDGFVLGFSSLGTVTSPSGSTADCLVQVDIEGDGVDFTGRTDYTGNTNLVNLSLVQEEN